MNTQRTLCRDDAAVILRLAEQMPDSSSADDIAEHFLDMVAHATILPADTPAVGHAAIGLTVVYEEVGSRTQHAVTLVEPAQADARAGRISLLTPVGRALIGLAEGERATVELPGGKQREVRVLATGPDLQPAA